MGAKEEGTTSLSKTSVSPPAVYVRGARLDKGVAPHSDLPLEAILSNQASKGASWYRCQITEIQGTSGNTSIQNNKYLSYSPR